MKALIIVTDVRETSEANLSTWSSAGLPSIVSTEKLSKVLGKIFQHSFTYILQ